jgi:small subunit ribosomal protein S17
MAKKVLKGVVISDKMDKTRVVLIERLMKLSNIGKYVKRKKKYKVHDEYNKSSEGDVISIEECRPLSKDKRFRIVQIAKKEYEEFKNDSNADKIKGSR